MDRIKDAISRVSRGQSALPLKARGRSKKDNAGGRPDREAARAPTAKSGSHEPNRFPVTTAIEAPAPDRIVKLNRAYLEKHRVFAYDGTDKRSIHYDMLRTQVLQACNARDMRMLAVTAPHAGAGKTVTSINLAFSIARMSEQRVLLVDLDLRKASVVGCLGLQPKSPLKLRPKYGIGDVLAGTCTIAEAAITTDLCDGRFSVLVAPKPVPLSTEQISSPKMKKITANLKEKADYSTVIFDLPPMLSSDDFLAFLPQVDGALLVTEANENNVQQITECVRLIGDEKLIGCVLNKAAQEHAGYGYYG